MPKIIKEPDSLFVKYRNDGKDECPTEIINAGPPVR